MVSVLLTAVGAAGTVDAAAVAATFALDVIDSSAEVGFVDAAVHVAFAAFVASVAFVVGKSFELAVAAFAVVGNCPCYPSSYLKILLGHKPSVPTLEGTY